MSRFRCVLLPLLAVSAAAQTAATHSEFEVSSIKPAQPIEQRADVGLHIDGAQLHAAQMSLRDLIQIAWRVKYYQVEGPDWLAASRFDVDAKLPEGATRSQVPEMLQTLLEERFGLKVHHATKDVPVYGLVAAGDGPKMKATPADDPAFAPCQNATSVKVDGGRGGVKADYGCGSYFLFSDDRLEGVKLTMLSFADMLGRFTDRPVVDQTKLAARYDFSLDLSHEDYMAMLIRSAVVAGVNLPPEALRMMNSGEDSLTMALRRLGLKLDSRKAPFEAVVVDEIGKTPSAN